MNKQVLVVAAGLLCAAPVSAQSVFNGFTQNPNCNAGSANGCAVSFAPTGAALAARTSFLGSLSSSTVTQDFEGIANGTSAPLTLGFGVASATLSGTGAVSRTVDELAFGRFATSGSQFWQATSNPGGTGFSISFSQHIAGFGFFAMDLGELGGGLLLRFMSGATVVSTQSVLAGAANTNFNPLFEGGMRFFGVTFGSNAFDRVEFVLDNPGGGTNDVFAFDDMTVADVSQVVNPPNVVPEPSTYALLATGLAGLGIMRRRRRAQG